jgi:phosphatidylinositol alpha-1,6-mannosyltransferase
MGELAKRYPAGSLVVSTGQYLPSQWSDLQFPNLVDRLPIASRRLRTLLGLVRWSRRAVALVQSFGVEFIWCGNLKPASYPARWARARTGTPYGVLLHGGDLLILRRQARDSLLKRRMAAGLLQPASVLVTNSSWTAELCRSLLGELEIRIKPDQLQTVLLGADPSRFRPGLDQSEVRARYHLDERRWLLSVARLTRHKGIDTALRVLAELAPDYPDLGYIVVGSGDELPQLQALARELGVVERVRFLTSVPDDDLTALYNCAEVYLGLSKIMAERAEGFGISLAEASASGVPVLATRSGGIPDAVRDGETGLLVDADEPGQISAALRALLNDRALGSRLGSAGRRAVESFYNWDRVAGDLLRIGAQYARAPRRPSSLRDQAAESSGRTLMA